MADPSAKDRLTAALAAEGIGTMDGTTLAAYPTRVEFVTVRHRDRDRTLQIRDRLGLGEF